MPASTIALQWQQFKTDVLAEITDEALLRPIQYAFYAGAGAFMELTYNATGELTDDQAAQFLLSLRTEILDHFKAELQLQLQEGGANAKA